MSRLPTPLHVSFRSLRVSVSSTSARLLPPRQLYSTQSDDAAPDQPLAESSLLNDDDEPKPFKAPFHLPHQYARVQTPNIIDGKVPRTTFDGAIPKEGVFTPQNAHLSSKPLSVRQREAYALDLLKPGELPPVLKPRELQDWWLARAEGTLPDEEPPVTEEEVRASQEAFKQDIIDSQRDKIHGIDKDGKILGQRIYLPNIVFRLIPNATHFIRPKSDRKGNLHANQRNKPVAMEQYNPYIATFRVPPALNKIDIKGYLKAVYNLDTTFVHTSINHKTRYKSKNGRGEWKNGKSKDNYKRAVVGLKDPFYYPEDPLGMKPDERKAYEERLDAQFRVTQYRESEVAMRRRQFANVRNVEGASERTAKIYGTKPPASLKRVLPAEAKAREEVRSELRQAVLDMRSAASKAQKEKDAAVDTEVADPAAVAEEDDWRSRS